MFYYKYKSVLSVLSVFEIKKSGTKWEFLANNLYLCHII